MRSDIPAATDTTRVSRIREPVLVTYYGTGSLADLIAGTAGGAVDLTPYAAGVTQTDSQASVKLAFQGPELTGANRPKPGRPVAVTVGGYVLFQGPIESVSGDREVRAAGQTRREINLTVRRRDAMPWWRDVRRMSPIFSAGVELGAMARAIATSSLGLTDLEIDIPDIGVSLAHGSAQLVDLNGWDMLELCFAPGLREPWVDGRGILKTISRDVRRPADLVLTAEQVVDVTSSTSRPPLTTYRVKWLDPAQSKVVQQEQSLGQTTITCGFFKQHEVVGVWYSEDRKQRAENTRLVEKSSINAGVVGKVADVSFVQIDEYHGDLHADCDLSWFIASLFVEVGALVGSAAIPDVVNIFAEMTIPVGRLVQNAALMAILFTITKQGHGVYEVWGLPFDWVHSVNEIEAYDDGAEEWQTKLEEMQNDLIPNEDIATSLAVNELVYASREASKASLTIADDLRIERGDILSRAGRRFYVQGYSRDLSRGADSVLKCDGFWL